VCILFKKQDQVTLNQIIKMKKKLIVFTVTLFFVLSHNVVVFAQQLPSAESTLNKVSKYYNALKEFDVEIEYEMYKGYSGSEVTESYKGTIYRGNDVTHIKILSSEIIQFKEEQLIIDKDYKTITYSEPNGNIMNSSPTNMTVFLQYYKESKTLVTDTNIVHEMVLKNPQLPTAYNRIIIYVNKSTHKIEKQVLYFSNKLPFVDDDGKENLDSARMEINFKDNPKPNGNIPKLEDYLVVTSNNKLELTGSYKSYKLINKTNL